VCQSNAQLVDYVVQPSQKALHPSANIATANAQVTTISQTLLKQLPAGATPPLIVNYSASTVPIIQLALLEHAIAALLDVSASTFSIKPQIVDVALPQIPSGVPISRPRSGA